MTRLPSLTSLQGLRRLAARLGVALLAAGCAVTAPQGQPVSERYEDPPARVGRISYVAGDVTLTDTLHGDREAATLNWPVTSAQRLSSGPNGVAEVRIGSLAVFLDVNSVVDFVRIDDDEVDVMVQQGSVALRARSAEVLNELTLTTPRERVVLDQIGRYRIDVDREPGTTAVSTVFGQARVVAAGGTFAVRAGQRGEISASPYTSFRLVPPGADGFDNWVAQRDRRDDQWLAERYVGPEMTGIESLDDHGTWRTVESYGVVWVPRAVPVGWAPYRFGRWAWIAPWGWTWIDDAPWGFAPFHYGRWAYAGGSWFWVPGAYARRPVYAPALVAWYGTPGVSITISSGPPIGWFPLGPGEIYVPGYRVSRRYVNWVNHAYVRDIDRVPVVRPPARYINQIHPDAVTYAPPRALPSRMRIQEVATRTAPDLSRATVQPRPPLEVDERFAKRRLVPGGVAAAAPSASDSVAVPSTPRPQPRVDTREGPFDARRGFEGAPARPGEARQERGAPPLVTRPPAALPPAVAPVAPVAPSARPEPVPPPKRALLPGQAPDSPGTRGVAPRAEPRFDGQPAPRLESPRPQPTAPAPRIEMPRAQPPVAAPPAVAPRGEPPAAAQRSQPPAPPPVRTAPPPRPEAAPAARPNPPAAESRGKSELIVRPGHNSRDR